MENLGSRNIKKSRNLGKKYLKSRDLGTKKGESRNLGILFPPFLGTHGSGLLHLHPEAGGQLVNDQYVFYKF